MEGQNLAVEYRWAEGQFDRLPSLAADLVRRDVRLIAALGGSTSPLAAKKATATIPIVFSSGEIDPVKSGLVVSLNRPGGNVTGVSPMTGVLLAKRLELLREITPRAGLVGYLLNSSNPNSESQSRDVHEAARALGLELHAQSASSDPDFETAFEAFSRRRVGALFVGNDPFFLARRQQIVALAARYSLPASYFSREFVAGGGLMSYAASFVDGYRLAGLYSGRILKGEKPSDLPVVQSVKFELVTQPQDRQGARPRSAADAARPRRRGDRVRTPRVHHAARRCGARGRWRRARSSRRNAGDRFPPVRRPARTHVGWASARACVPWLRRRPERGDRLALRRRYTLIVYRSLPPNWSA